MAGVPALGSGSDISVPVPDRDGFRLRYGLVLALLFLLQEFCNFFGLAFPLNGLNLLVVLPFFMGVCIYFFIAFLNGAVNFLPWRCVSVIAGPASAWLLFSLFAHLGFTPDYALFIWRRGDFTSWVAEFESKTQPPYFRILHLDGLFLVPDTITVVAYDPSRQVLLLPQERSKDWIRRATADWNIHVSITNWDENYMFQPREAGEFWQHVGIRRLKDDFYTITVK
ncbi:MAG TPA: hypothetical protein VGC15_00085 [Acetobacteraceae bacterium]